MKILELLGDLIFEILLLPFGLVVLILVVIASPFILINEWWTDRKFEKHYVKK